eukprot:scaffold9457_cov78-Cylindrotheca_fusiformis.AAC.1
MDADIGIADVYLDDEDGQSPSNEEEEQQEENKPQEEDHDEFDYDLASRDNNGEEPHFNENDKEDFGYFNDPTLTVEEQQREEEDNTEFDAVLAEDGIM